MEKLAYKLVLFCSLLLIAGCSPSKSFVEVGMSKEEVLNIYTDFFESYDVDHRISKDTILYGFYVKNQPVESIMLFKNDTCYYQEINMYCSICYDKAIRDILRDKRYNFEVLDAANYRSTKQPNIIMRIKDNPLKEESCSKIRISDTRVRE